MAGKGCDQIDKLLSKGKITKALGIMNKGDLDVVCHGITQLALIESEEARNAISTYLDDGRDAVRIAAIHAHAVIGMDYCKTRLQYRHRMETNEEIKEIIMKSIQIINKKK